MHEWAVPRYQDFARQGQELTQAIDEACEAGPPTASPPTRLRDLQQRWVETAHTWRQLEALQLGATLKRRSSRYMDFWPTRPQTIERAAQMTAEAPVSGSQADELMARWGTAAKGLPALEWMLFPASAQDEVPLWRSPAMCLYARRVARGLAQEGAVLRDAWQLQAAGWSGAPAAEVRQAVHDALNLMVGSCELLRGKKLQKGARLRELGGPESGLIFAFDSVRSGQTKAFLLVHFEAVAQLLLGRQAGLGHTQAAMQEAPATGLADMLRAQGFKEAKVLLPAVRKAHAALRALPADPQQWTLARTDAAARALRALRETIDPPIAQALQVTITFTDADGD
jgi:predicted lipoprotein